MVVELSRLSHLDLFEASLGQPFLDASHRMEG
jgi:hypothetical protein